MAIVVNMPRLSDTMEEGVVAKWLKQVGDKIEEGDILAEIETDKATMEFESFNEGTLLHIGVQEGETSPVDVLLAIIGEEGEDISALLKGAESGGCFEYAPNLRLKNDECFEEVKKVLDGDRARVKKLKLCSGDLQFFLGRYSLHRVTHNNGNSDRLLLIQSFTETPGIVGSKERVKDLYGKITQVHDNIVGVQNRNDSLLD